MAISDQQIFDWFLANPNADDATVAATMDQFKLTPADIARATGTDLSNVQSRYEAVAPQTGIVTIPNTGVDTTNITGGITTLVTPVVTATSPVVTVTSPVVTVTSPTVDTTLVSPVVTAVTPIITGTSPTITETLTSPVVTVTSPTVEADTGGISRTVIDQINAAWNSGNYKETAAIIAAAGLTPAQIKAYYGLDDATMDYVLSKGIYAPVVSPVVTPVVSTSPTVLVSTTPTVVASVTTTASPSVVAIDTLAVAGSGGNLLNIPGYGEVSSSALNSWEPWRLQMLGITKNSDGTFAYGGGPAWETTVGTTNRSLYDQINSISNLQGMNGLFTGGALGKEDGGLGSKEAVLWDFANKLSAAGVTSLADIGRRMVTREVQTEQGSTTVQEEEIYNKLTGKAINIQGTTLGNNTTDYGFTFTNTGLAIPTTKEVKNGWADFKENTLPLILSAVSIAVPGTAPYIQAYNAAKAAQNGQWAAAAFSALASASGFSAQTTAEIDALTKAGKLAEAEQLYNNSWLAQNAGNLSTAKDAASFINALDQKNVAGVINAGLNMAGATVPAEVRTAVNWANFGNAIANNDYAGMANAASALTGSSNIKVAASAANFMKALDIFGKTGNTAGLISAGNAFGNIVKSLPTTDTTKVATNDETINSLLAAGLTEQQINDLNLFKTGAKIDSAYTNTLGEDSINNVIVGGSDLLASADGSKLPGPPKLAPGAIQTDLGGLPKFIGTFSFETQSNITAPVLKDSAGNLYYTVDGEKIGLNAIDYERAFYKANPTEYLRLAQEAYKVPNIDAINRLLSGQTNFGTSMADKVTTIDVTAKDVTGTTADTTGGTKSPFSSMADVLRTFGSLDVAETAMGIDALMKIPGVQEAMNAGYVRDLEAELKLDPSRTELLEEYKRITGRDFTPNVTDFGEVVITGTRITPSPVVSSVPLFLDADGNYVTKDDLDLLTSKSVSPSPSVGTIVLPPIGTPKVSVSPSVDTTPVVSVSPSVSPNVSVSPSVNPSVSVSPSVEPSVSVSVSPSVSPNVSVSPSVEPSVNPSVSVSPSVSPSVNTSVSASVSPNVSVSPSVSPSVSVSTSVSPSVSTSVSPSVSTSVSVSVSVKPSVSVTPTVTPSVSITPVITPVVSITPTITPSVLITPTVTPSVSITPTVTPTPSITPTVTPTPSITPIVTPTVKVSVKVSVTPTTSQPFTMPQAQNIAAAFGLPQLANVFYYGKEFGSKKQKLDKKGELEDEDYRALSVTKAGAEGELLEDIAEEKKNKENNANDALDLILGESSDSMSLDDLINIVKGA